MSAEALLIDKAQLLTLTAPEMTVLRRRSARARHQRRPNRTRRVHQAARDADQRLLRQPARHGHGVEAHLSGARTLFEGRDRKTGALKWTGTRVDLVFGSNAVPRGTGGESTLSSDAGEKFAKMRLRQGMGQGHDARPRLMLARSAGTTNHRKPEQSAQSIAGFLASLLLSAA